MLKVCLSVCLSVCPSQSETSFFILRIFEVLIELYYRLSVAKSSNLRSVFFNFFRINIFTQRITFFTKNFFFIRVDRRVIRVEELESEVSFFKFFSDRCFYTKNHFLLQKKIVPFSERKGYIVENIPAKYSK
jgi:hypothetical protein